MTDLQIKLEIAYILGTNHKEFEKHQAEQNKEILVDDFDSMVEEIANDFDAWQKGKDESLLQLLHTFLGELSEEYIANLIAKYGV